MSLVICSKFRPPENIDDMNFQACAWVNHHFLDHDDQDQEQPDQATVPCHVFAHSGDWLRACLELFSYPVRVTK